MMYNLVLYTKVKVPAPDMFTHSYRKEIKSTHFKLDYLSARSIMHHWITLSNNNSVEIMSSSEE